MLQIIKNIYLWSYLNTHVQAFLESIFQISVSKSVQMKQFEPHWQLFAITIAQKVITNVIRFETLKKIVSVIYCCINNHLQILWPKTIIYPFLQLLSVGWTEFLLVLGRKVALCQSLAVGQGGSGCLRVCRMLLQRERASTSLYLGGEAGCLRDEILIFFWVFTNIFHKQPF